MKRVVRLYYGFQFFFSLLFWLPVFYEYQRRIGLSDTQIFSIQSFYYTVFCLMEIPTGLIADLWGFRRCLRLGAVTLIFSNLLPIFLPSYSGFMAHFFLIALSRSFISGASSAYLYEYLRAQGANAEYKQIEGNARAYGLFGKMACLSVIGALMEWQLTLPYWLTVAAAAVAVAFAMKLPDIPRSTNLAPRLTATPTSSRLTLVLAPLRTLLLTLPQSPYLLLLMLQGVAIFVLARICQVNLFQPILTAKSFGLASHGAIMALMMGFEAIGSARPGWARRHFSDLNAVFVLTLIMAATLGALPLVGPIGALVMLCVFSIATGLSFPIQRQLLNDAIVDSSSRASMLSVESIIDRAACAVVAPLIGVFLGEGKLDSFLLLSAASTVAVMGVLFIILKFAPESSGAKGASC